MKCPLAVAAIAGAVLNMPASAGEPHEQATFRTRTAGVRVDVLVTRSGQPVRGLKVADFVLFDNGVPQTIQSADLEDVPLHVILALDTSASLAGPRLPTLINASQALVDELQDRDAVTVVTFHRRLDLLTQESRDHAAVRTALAGLRSGGATSLRDATYAGLMLPTSATERALLLVFTDGRDTGSWLTEEAVLEAARASNAVTYGVVIPEQGGPQSLLEQAADLTGGRLLRATDDDLRSSFQKVLTEFRARYLLTYSPADATAGWHRIDVRLRSGKGEVRARRGYLAR